MKNKIYVNIKSDSSSEYLRQKFIHQIGGNRNGRFRTNISVDFGRREKGTIKYRSLGRVYPGAICQTEKQISRRKELLAMQKEQRLLNLQLKQTLQGLEKQRMEEKMLSDYSFEVFWRDEITARVSVKGSKVHVSRYCEHPVKQLFAKENMTRYQLNKILEMRCFEKERGDIRQILEHLGLKEYNPQEIVKRTHGVSYNDYIWFRFPGENLTAKDVLVR